VITSRANFISARAGYTKAVLLRLCVEIGANQALRTESGQSNRNASAVCIIGQAEIATSNPKSSSSIKNDHLDSFLKSSHDLRIDPRPRFLLRVTVMMRGFIIDFVPRIRTRAATYVTLQTVAIQ
jgi:hypothetical protein